MAVWTRSFRASVMSSDLTCSRTYTMPSWSITTNRISGNSDTASSARKILALIDWRFSLRRKDEAGVTSVMSYPDLESVEITVALAAVFEAVHPLDCEKDPQAADGPLFQRLDEIFRIRHAHRAWIECLRVVLQRDDQRIIPYLATD